MLNSLSKQVLAQFVGKEHTFDLWTSNTTLFASQTQSRITNLRIAITTIKKGNISSTFYISKMKSLGDELAAAGRPVTDPEMVDYVLAGLDRDYDPVVAAIGAVHASSVNRGGGRGAVGWPGQLAGPRPRGGEVLSSYIFFCFLLFFSVYRFPILFYYYFSLLKI